MVKKILKKIKKFFKVKIYLNFPPKKNILLYDEIHSSILKNILKQDFNILKTREIELNLWIFLKQIIFFDFKFQTYTKNYIRFVDPKVIITFNDRKYQFYKLKKTFQNIIFISVQNGVHIPNFFKNKELIDSKNLKCDHFFVINKFYINKFNKFIKSKYHVLGRFTNNAVKVKKKIISNSFLLISQFDKSDSYLNDFYKKLLETLSVYFTKSNKKLYILLRSKDLFLQEEEKEFYKKFFKFNCVFKKCNNWKRSYEIVDRFENIIFMHSTLGYEAISRKKKLLFFLQKKLEI